MGLFAYSQAGFVVAHENEVRVWDAKIDGPRWWRPLNARVVGVGSAGSLISTLEESGVLALWDGATGAYVAGSEFRGPTGLAASGSGCAVATREGVELFGPSGRTALPIPGVSALRFSNDGASLGLGFQDGRVSILELASGRPLREAEIPGGAVTAVAERVPDEWFASAGSALHLVTGAAVTRVTGLGGKTVTDVWSGPRATMFALVADQITVALEWPSRDTICSQTYVDKTPLGVAFGPPGDDGFYVGLTGGDGNRRELRTGDLYRTDPHPGHVRNRWMVMPGFEAEIAARALR